MVYNRVGGSGCGWGRYNLRVYAVWTSTEEAAKQTLGETVFKKYIYL